MTTQSASLQVQVQPDHIEMMLGEQVSLEVRVYNASPIVDEFKLSLVGPPFDPIPADWVTANPPSLALFPNAAGAVLLTLQIPAASQFAAGAHRIGVRVASTTNPDHAHVEELTLSVASRPAATIRIEPEVVSGGKGSEFTLIARNTGNSPLTAQLSGDDPAAVVRFSFLEREIDLPLDSEERVPVEIEASRPLVGSVASRMFAVHAALRDRADEVGVESQPFTEPVSAGGTFLQSPWISGRLLSLIMLAMVVIPLGIAAWLNRPQGPEIILTGPLTFGAEGVVSEVQARKGDVLLKDGILAKLNPAEMQLALDDKQVVLREAIVARAALDANQLVASAEAALPPGTAASPASAPFLKALLEKVMKSQQDSLTVSGDTLNALSDSFQAYCKSLTTPLPDCGNPNFPLLPDTVAKVDADRGNEKSAAVLDANNKYKAVIVTLQNLTDLRHDVEEQLVAAGGAPAAVPTPGPEGDLVQQQLQEALAAKSATEADKIQADVLKADQAIAEARLACTKALNDVGRTVLRASVDVLVVTVDIQPGVRVKPDTPVVTVQSRDGRPFKPPAAERQPNRADIPQGETCPRTLDEIRATPRPTATPAP